MKPTFFIVGAQKCGTSSMTHYLEQHPDIFMGHEISYFCKDFHKEADKTHPKNTYYKTRTEKQYLALFSKTDKPIVGEKSANYLYSKVAAKEIAKFCPDAKIIIMLKDPVAFLRSWHAHAVFMRHETATTLNKALQLEKERKQGKRLPRLAKHASYLHYMEMAQFDVQVARFLRCFKPRQLKVILLENMKAHPEKTYREVLDFIGAKANVFTPKFENINPTRKVRSVALQNMIRNPKVPGKRLLKRLLPKVFAERLYKRFLLMNRTKRGKDKLPAELEERLRKRTAPVVTALQSLLSKNGLLRRNLLQAWHYTAQKSLKKR